MAISFTEALQKDQPGVGDVHISGGGAATKPKRKTARTFHEVVGDCAPGTLADPKPVTKGKKSPLYVSRKVTNAQDIIDWAKGQGFSTTAQADDMHATVLYSKQPMDWDGAGDGSPSVSVGATPSGRSVEPLGDEGATVLRFASKDLADRHQQFRDAGGSHDYSSYKPHVTISYQGAPADLSKVEPYAGPIEFGPERLRPIDGDWKSGVVTKGAVTFLDVLKGTLGLPHPHTGNRTGRKARIIDIKSDPHAANPLERRGNRRLTGWGGRVGKSAAAADFGLTIEITKADEDKRQMFGWASVIEKDGQPVEDWQGDVIDADELEPAAYDFVVKSREGDDMHVGAPVSHLIESMVFTKEKQAALGIDLGKVGWWTGWQVNDPGVWAAHKRGERNELSIGGSAIREAM